MSALGGKSHRRKHMQRSDNTLTGNSRAECRLQFETVKVNIAADHGY